MKTSCTTLVIVILFLFSCQEKERKENIVTSEDRIEGYLNDVLEKHEIPGMAVAVISNGKLIHRGFYGKISLETGQPITPNTTFKIFSLTKTLVALGIFKLIEEGELRLDDTLSEHFKDLPVLWKNVEVGHLLSHSSGLPDVRQNMNEFQNDAVSNEDFIKLLYEHKMEFPTGSQWNYNQTNYILLRMLIEKISGSGFEDYILTRQFSNPKPDAIYFSSTPFAVMPNRAQYYDFDKKSELFKTKQEFVGNKNLPLAGLNLTLDEYVAWNGRLDSNELIGPASKSKMWTPFDFKASNRKFLYGWDVYQVGNSESFGFSGGSVSGFRKFVEKDLTVIVLTTGYKNYALQDIIIDFVAGIVDEGLRDTDLVLTEDIMAEFYLEKDGTDTTNMLTTLKGRFPSQDFGQIFTSIGLNLFFQMDRKEEAIALMKLNVKEHPMSADTFGTLGYMYLLDDQLILAKENYSKALEIDPSNTYSESRITEIDEKLKKEIK